LPRTILVGRAARLRGVVEKIVGEQLFEGSKLPPLCTSSALRRTTAFAASLGLLIVMACPFLTPPSFRALAPASEPGIQHGLRLLDSGFVASGRARAGAGDARNDERVLSAPLDIARQLLHD